MLTLYNYWNSLFSFFLNNTLLLTWTYFFFYLSYIVFHPYWTVLHLNTPRACIWIPQGVLIRIPLRCSSTLGKMDCILMFPITEKASSCSCLFVHHESLWEFGTCFFTRKRFLTCTLFPGWKEVNVALYLELV